MGTTIRKSHSQAMASACTRLSTILEHHRLHLRVNQLRFGCCAFGLDPKTENDPMKHMYSSHGSLTTSALDLMSRARLQATGVVTLLRARARRMHSCLRPTRPNA